MADAIAEFRSSGSPDAVLRVLGASDQLALPVLQRALKRAGTTDERKAFEDVAFAITARHPWLPQTARASAVAAARQHFGEGVAEIVDVGRFADGFAAALDCEPPTAAMAAAIGLEAARRIANPLSIVARDAGADMSVTRVNCAQCAGDPGRRGDVVCRRCLGRAEAAIQRGEYATASGPPQAIDVLTQFAGAFGCVDCGRRPVQHCECLRIVTVPTQPRDGQLVKGRHARSGQDCWFTLVLRAER